MDQIIHKVHTVDPNNSDAVKEALSAFFKKLPTHDDPVCNIWLQEMRTIIDRFPKYCMSHRTNMENYFAGFITSKNYYSVIEVAKCAHALLQVRPKNEKTATPKSNWRDQMNLLCSSSHTLISAILPNEIDIYKDNISADLISPTTRLGEFLTDELTKVKNAKDKQAILQIRLNNLFVFIQAMLVETFPVGKPIRPQIILDVIVRALSVTSGSNQKEDIASIKIEALKTLDALIFCLGSNLIPFSPLIFRLVMQTLRWSSENPTEANRNVRKTAYHVLTNWLCLLHTHKSSNILLEDELTAHILGDVSQPKKIVELTMGPQPTKHLSKKAKRKLANTQLQESAISAHIPGEKNKKSFSEKDNNEVAIAALECAEVFLTVCGRFLKPNTHKLFQEHIVRECFNNSYEDDFLIHLLRVLEASRKTTPNTVPPPTQYCLQVYSTLVNVQNSEISKFCSQAILDIRLHLYCSPPSINFEVEVPQTAAPISTIKKISKRNRAALESLLGKDRVPEESVEDPEEEIITIPDEPSYKKLRLDADKISLSSDDVHPSVEISDDSDDSMIIDETVTFNETAKEDESPSPETDQLVDIEETVLNEANTNESKSLNEDKVINENLIEEDNNVNVEESIIKDAGEQETVPIYEAVTQLPVNSSSEPYRDVEETLSLEVTYDFPNTGTGKVTILEKIDGDNLPSTNETDDIQITCGQIVKNSQDDEKIHELEANKTEPKTNGMDPLEIVQNGDISKDGVDGGVTKIVQNVGVSVEDMLADFVDEVNDEPTEA